MTSFQKLLIQNIELKYGLPAKEVLTTLRTKPLTWRDIGAVIGCGQETLRWLREHFNIEPTKNVIYERRPVFPNATVLFKKFDNPEDAVVECRQERKLRVEDAANILGVSKSTVTKYTPDWLKFTYNMSEQGLKIKQETGRKSGRFRTKHPWRDEL